MSFLKFIRIEHFCKLVVNSVVRNSEIKCVDGPVCFTGMVIDAVISRSRHLWLYLTHRTLFCFDFFQAGPGRSGPSTNNPAWSGPRVTIFLNLNGRSLFVALIHSRIHDFHKWRGLFLGRWELPGHSLLSSLLPVLKYPENLRWIPGANSPSRIAAFLKPLRRPRENQVFRRFLSNVST